MKIHRKEVFALELDEYYLLRETLEQLAQSLNEKDVGAISVSEIHENDYSVWIDFWGFRFGKRVHKKETLIEALELCVTRNKNPEGFWEEDFEIVSIAVFPAWFYVNEEGEREFSVEVGWPEVLSSSVLRKALAPFLEKMAIHMLTILL